MTFAAGLWVAVLDGSRALMLENEGNAAAPRLVVREHYSHDNPPTHEQGSDRPGRVYSSSGGQRSSVEAPDLHQRAEDAFVRQIAERLEDASTNCHAGVVIVAPPAALGLLRDVMGPLLSARVVKEIAADLTKMPVPEITKAIAAALKA